MKDSLKRLGIKRGSILAGLLMFATIPIPGWKDNPTGLQISHEHAVRWTMFAIDSSDNNSNSIAVLDKKIKARAMYEGLKSDMYRHEDRLYELVDDAGNFKSDFKRKMWEKRDDKLKQDIQDIKKDLKRYDSLLDTGQQYAMRQR